MDLKFIFKQLSKIAGVKFSGILLKKKKPAPPKETNNPKIEAKANELKELRRQYYRLIEERIDALRAGTLNRKDPVFKKKENDLIERIEYLKELLKPYQLGKEKFCEYCDRFESMCTCYE